mgnify:CR=1 FL=1
MENEELTMLPVSAIYPHPDNPRKDVGDVTELADSIKKRGILQNLTVMPGHWLTMDEMAAVVEAYTEDPTDELKRANVKDDSAEQILANMQIITDVLKNPVPNRKIEDLEGDEESEQTGTTE